MELVIIGTIVNHHGLKGEVRVIAHTDYPEERFKKGKTFYVLKENEYEKIIIDSVRS
jgi:16S rRNA processing protein RimM